MNRFTNKSKPWGSSEVDPIQQSVSDKKDSISTAVPLCLPNNYTWNSFTKKIYVDKTKTRKSLTVCTEGLELLQSLKDQLLVVLCIAGPARSGKSFFASQLVEDVNFDVGHGAGSHNTGIWIGVGARPIRIGNDEARVVILDAEGLGGVNTDGSHTDAKWDHKIFSLCVLLSSYVIYNSKGPPNNDELDKLGFIAEFSRSICPEMQDDVDKLQTPSEGLGQFGPDFLWLFRDNLFTPDLNGQACDWTEFVKNALLDLKRNEPERNHIRKSISSTFRTIQAADLPPPTFDSKVVRNLLAVVNKDKINQEFFLELRDLENEHFNNLPVKPSCMELKIADEKVNVCYNKGAKGPKAGQVKSEKQLQRDQKIGRMKTESLIYAEQQSCEIFEKSLKEALQGEPLSQSELNAQKKTCIDGCFNNFRKASCNDMDCNPCFKSKQSLHQKVESIFKECSSECYDKSEKACRCLINELMKRILLPFVENIDSQNYSDFRKIKDEILAQYDLDAKGQAKKDLVGTCTKTIDMQKEGMQLLIIQSALKSVYCEYTQILNSTAITDPCEDDELDKMLALKRRDMISAFGVKCEGIDKSKLKPYQLNLEDLIKNFTTWIANENKRRSINLCEDLVTSLSRRFYDGIMQTHLNEILHETEHSQYSDHLQKAEEFKNKILNDYKQKARGPEKERFHESLNKYIEIHLTIVKNVVYEMILKTVLQHHFDQLDTIKQKYPISEIELRSAISKTNKNTEKEFIEAQKQISLPFGSCSKDILSIILNFDTVQLVEENYKESMRQLDSICKHISLESRMKFEEIWVVKRIPVKLIFADCRTAIENLVQGNRYEQDDLEYDIERIKEDARKKIEKLQKEDAEANIIVTVETLTIELKDTISYVNGKNLRISSEICNAQLREVMKALKNRCKIFLVNEISTVETLCNIKTKCLGEYENGVIGPAKDTVKEALEKEIDKEIQRTYVLFAKAKYRETLLVETEAFQYEDQVKTLVEVNLDELTKVFEKESKDILLRYPWLDVEISNELWNDLRKEREFYVIVLKQKITLTSEVANYRSSIEALIKDGPCEEEHLKAQIGKKRKEAWESIEKTFKKVEQTNFALTDEMLRKALEDTTRNLETQNYTLSTTKCNSLLLQVSEELKCYCKDFLATETSEIDNLRHLKVEYLHEYDEVAIGPAKRIARKILEKEIVREVESTFVLFSKAKYRETLRVQTEAFKYEDQVNTSVEVNLDELTEYLEKESQDILLKYPGLDDKISNQLWNDLRKVREFDLKVLNQKITLTSEVAQYRSSIEVLIKDGPCEEEHLKEQIDKKRTEAWESIGKTLKEVEQRTLH
ncbi:amine-terminal domain guanylate-binding protein [Apostichopus japonicus]|uniref:Amine-terminal domain guanylate-binding protein n=1 Tax=Stichopus japonicus TaxID=307972 RepID=A0A2G8LHY1_STIJA|nr:amine-terminal domain guanylate-binding protein [Apostichopus japonicus]